MRVDVLELAWAVMALSVTDGETTFVGTPEMYERCTEVTGDMRKMLDEAIDLLRANGEISGRVVIYNER